MGRRSATVPDNRVLAVFGLPEIGAVTKVRKDIPLLDHEALPGYAARAEAARIVNDNGICHTPVEAEGDVTLDPEAGVKILGYVSLGRESNPILFALIRVLE